MSITRYLVLFITVFNIFSTIVRAEEFTVDLGDNEDVDITQQVGIYYDYSRSLDLEKIRSLPNDKFHSLKGKVSDGFKDANIWIKFVLDASDARQTTWYFYEKWFSNDHMIFYYVSPEGQVTSQENGILSDSSPPFESRKFTFEVDNSNGQATGEYYLKVSVYVPTLYGFGLATEKAYGESIAAENLIFGLYYGAMLVVILHALIMARIHNMYLYFAAFASSLTAWNFVLNGFRRQFLGPVLTSNEIPWFNFDQPASAINFAGIFLIITFTLFSRKFLDTENTLPIWAQKVIDYTFYVGCATCVGLLLVREPLVISAAYGYHTIAIAEFFLVTIWIAFVKDRGLAMMIATLPFLIMLVSMIMNVASSMSYLQSGFISRYGIQVSSAIALLLFSFSLSQRFANSKKLAFEEKNRNAEILIKQSAINKVVDRFATDLTPKLDKINDLCGQENRYSAGDSTSSLRSIYTITTGIRKTILRLSELVKMEFDQDIKKEEKFSLPEIMKELHRRYIKYCYDNNINFSVQRNSQIPEVIIGDPEKVIKLVDCLVENAIFGSGSDRVTVKTDITSRSPDSISIAITVEDTGTNLIDRDIAEIMFDITEGSFSAAHRLPAECFGIRMVSEIVNHLNGKVRFENGMPNLRVVTTLDFRLPG